jgi:hypothetical protein
VQCVVYREGVEGVGRIHLDTGDDECVEGSDYFHLRTASTSFTFVKGVAECLIVHC